MQRAGFAFSGRFGSTVPALVRHFFDLTNTGSTTFSSIAGSLNASQSAASVVEQFPNVTISDSKTKADEHIVLLTSLFGAFGENLRIVFKINIYVNKTPGLQRFIIQILLPISSPK